MIKIVVDSTCSLNEEYAKKNDIFINPLRILFEDEEFIESEKLYDKIYQKMKETNEIPKTSQPSLDSYINIFNKIIADGNEAIVITISQTLSGTYNCALLARQNCDNPEKIHVIDGQTCGQASVGYVYEIVDMIKKGKTANEIIAQIEKYMPNSAVTFIPESFENLKKNGRIGSIKAFVATFLNIKPIIFFRAGILTGDKKVVGMTMGVNELIKLIPEKIKRLFIIRAGMPDYFEKFKEKVLKTFTKKIPIEIGTISPVVGAHVGQSIGLAWVSE